MGGCQSCAGRAVGGGLSSMNKNVENEYWEQAHGDRHSVAIGGPGAQESAVHRAPDTKAMTMDDIYRKYYGGPHGTVLPKLKEAVDKYGSTRRAMAWRPVTRVEKTTIKEDGRDKPWEYIHLGRTRSMTFDRMWTTMMAFGNGLLRVGLKPGDKIGLYDETRYEWLCGLYGLWSQKMVGVTVYSNLGEDALRYAIKEAELQGIILNAKAVDKFRAMCQRDGIPTPIIIVLDDMFAPKAADPDRGSSCGSPESASPGASPLGSSCSDYDLQRDRTAGIQDYGPGAHTFKEVCAKGAADPHPPLPRDAEAMALIMYTSGTTGNPKGVVMTHGNVYACVTGLIERLIVVLPDDTQPGVDQTSYVSYLPLAHILEFAAENVILMVGGMLGYGNPRTLTDLSAKPCGDLVAHRPVILVGVPRVFDTIKKGVEAKIRRKGPFAQQVFQRAYRERLAAMRDGKETELWNRKVFSKIADNIGGRCRACISGGAPLSGPTMEFVSVCFLASVVQGYGLTETMASCTVQRFFHGRTENIGALLPTVEVKLRDVEQWRHTDPDGPRGEVMIRGAVVTKGYYKQADKTKEAFLDDGWFCTGDVGQICKDDGSMKIVGRVKALAKNLNGEYIAMEALESTYVLNDVALPNGVCVLVNPQKSYICALVLTDQKKARDFARKEGVACGDEYPAMLDSPEFQAKAAASMKQTAAEAGKQSFEQVKRVRVLADEWTPENGVMTAAMKLKRNIVEEKYATVIADLFRD